MSTLGRIHRGLAFFFLAVGVVAFFLAGLAAFGAESFDAHRGSGSLMVLLSLILLILAAVGRREALTPSAVLFALMLIQMGLAFAGEDVGFLGGLHPVNGLLVLFVAHQAARGLPVAPRAEPSPVR
jgi:hypothetical protein